MITAEQVLEENAIQKWLALFPDGQEAWAEVRVQAIQKDTDNPDVPACKFVRRIVFLEYDKDRNGAALEAAKTLLGGPNLRGTPLW